MQEKQQKAVVEHGRGAYLSMLQQLLHLSVIPSRASLLLLLLCTGIHSPVRITYFLGSAVAAATYTVVLHCCCCCLQEKQQQAIVERCREAYLAMLQRNATGRVLSHRARSHLRQACLAAATHKVLLEEAPVSLKSVNVFFFWQRSVCDEPQGEQPLAAWLAAATHRVLMEEAPVSWRVLCLFCVPWFEPQGT
jgi:hypothetical protein